jgi:hypothetical protein
MRTVPVNQSVGPLPEGCEPFLFISIVELLYLIGFLFGHPIARGSLEFLARGPEQDLIHVHVS